MSRTARRVLYILFLAYRIASKHKWLYDLLLVVAAVLVVSANLLPLEVQKRIVNDAILLRKFELLAYYCGIYLIAAVAASLL